MQVLDVAPSELNSLCHGQFDSSMQLLYDDQIYCMLRLCCTHR
jgi:hypothetical protein